MNVQKDLPLCRPYLGHSAGRTALCSGEERREGAGLLTFLANFLAAKDKGPKAGSGASLYWGESEGNEFYANATHPMILHWPDNKIK